MVADSKTERFMEHFYNDTTPVTLWHYTDCNGLVGIIEDKKLKLWFTRSDCLNDISEGKDIEKYYSTVCQDLLNQNMISQEFYNAIEGVKPTNDRLLVYPSPPKPSAVSKRKMSVTSISHSECETFICCFSSAENSLEMWRYYSQKDGYALGVLTQSFQNLRSKPFDEFCENSVYNCVRFDKVLYSEQDKKDKIRKLILGFNGYVNSGKMELEVCVKHIVRQLSWLQFVFKDECFCNEQEYRLTYFRPVVKPNGMKQNLPEIKYRNREGIVVP